MKLRCTKKLCHFWATLYASMRAYLFFICSFLLVPKLMTLDAWLLFCVISSNSKHLRANHVRAVEVKLTLSATEM